MELAALKANIRNYRACIKNLAKAKSAKQQDYWSGACQHWDNQICMSLTGRPEEMPTLTKMVQELKANIEMLSKEVDPLIVEDLQYRLDSIVETFMNDGKPKMIIEA